DPKGMAQIEFFNVVLVPVGLTILLQRLPAGFGVPSEHFESFTESQLFFGVEMRSVKNLSGTLSDQPNVSVTQQSGQVQEIEVSFLCGSLKVTLQFGNDPSKGLFGLRPVIEIMGERKGPRPAIFLDCLDSQWHEGMVKSGRTVEIADRRVPNV